MLKREAPAAAEEGPRKVPKNELDLNRSDKEVWLVKVPALVYAAWQATDADTDVGKLVVRTDPRTGRTTMTVQLKPPTEAAAAAANAAAAGGYARVSTAGAPGSGSNAPPPRAPKAAPGGGAGGVQPLQVPTEYVLESEKTVKDALAFSGVGPQGRPAVAAQVVRSYNMQPRMGDQYRVMAKQRLYNDTMHREFVKPVAAKDLRTVGMLKRGKVGVFDEAFHEYQKNKLAAQEAATEAASGTKREKMETEALRSCIFRMFEQQDRWTLKEMNAQLNQPDAHLKEVLKPISELIRKGPNKNTYQLLPQFKAGGSSSGGT